MLMFGWQKISIVEFTPLAGVLKANCGVFVCG